MLYPPPPPPPPPPPDSILLSIPVDIPPSPRQPRYATDPYLVVVVGCSRVLGFACLSCSFLESASLPSLPESCKDLDLWVGSGRVAQVWRSLFSLCLLVYTSTRLHEGSVRAHETTFFHMEKLHFLAKGRLQWAGRTLKKPSKQHRRRHQNADRRAGALAYRGGVLPTPT